MAIKDEDRAERLRHITEMLDTVVSVDGTGPGLGQSDETALAILRVAREAMSLESLEDIEIVYPDGYLGSEPTWVRPALRTLLPRLARLLALERFDGQVCLTGGETIAGSIVDHLTLGAQVFVFDAEVTLTVVSRSGQKIGFELDNQTRHETDNHIAVPSRGFRVWTIVPGYYADLDLAGGGV